MFDCKKKLAAGPRCAKVLPDPLFAFVKVSFNDLQTTKTSGLSSFHKHVLLKAASFNDQTFHWSLLIPRARRFSGGFF